ncbi:VQ motif-containing protein [Quillaja saponaria]|uniref:VQ motif-containing protein n=1 Tax=Quillaja saponaria TaxID=32244 RepID=A0AAD7LET9_QUISA|nr:VQ motif-containing protein [Quillaja saponaria]
MDSGNSGSMQSSSTGGDEEYDSRAESISTFLNNPPSNRVGSLPQPQPPASQLFDPLSSYFDPIQRSQLLTNPQNSLLNLDMVWSKPFRSDPNRTDLDGLNQAFYGQTRGSTGFPAATQQMYPLPIPESSGSGGLISNDQAAHTNNTNVVRNPKKRTRASRRAPTTVLTTDTTNFRAMVQEFTGIPAPPFTSSTFPRSRLDIFGTAALRSAHNLDPPPPTYLSRPFAQKLHPPLPISSSSSSAPPLITDTLPTSTCNNSTSINYQLSPSMNPLNMLNFQSFLKSSPSPKYPLNPNSLTSNKHQQQGFANLGHVLEDFGLSSSHHDDHHHGTGNLISGLEMHNMVSSSSNEALSSSINNDHHQAGILRSSTLAEGSGNGKVNYSSNFQGDKGPESLARNEGIVESWINCSSD